MPSLVFDVSALDRASQAFERIANRVDMLVARLAALDRMNANPRLDVDTDPADRTLGRFEMNFRRRIRDTIANIPTVDIDVRLDMQGTERDLQEIREELAALTDKRIGIDLTAAQAVAEIERLRERLRILDLSDASIDVKANTAAAIAELEALLAEIRRVDGQDVEVDVKVDTGAFRALINASALFQRSLAQVARGPGLVLAVPGVLSLIDSLSDLVGLLGLLPSLAFGAAAGVAALVVGMQGFGDALKNAGDPEAFAEALKNLTPAAQSAAIAIKGLMDSWQGVIDATQEALFDDIDVAVGNISNLLPNLQAGLQGVASGINAIATSWADWAGSFEPTKQLGQIFENIRNAVTNLAPGITSVAEALTDMALVGARMLPQLADGFSDAAGDFADFINEVTANGQFEAWIQNAIDTLTQLGGIVIDVFGGIGGLFDALNADGTTFLDTLERWAAAFNEFANSFDGQAKIIAFFEALESIGSALGPILAGVFTTLATAIVTVAPGLAQIGAALAQVVAAAGPGVAIFGAFVAALAPIATVLAAIVTALGPIPGVLLAAFLGFRLAGTILAGFAAAIKFVIPSIAALGASLRAMSTSLAVAGLGGAIGAAGTAVTGFAGILRGVAAFLVGPWGFAILGAIAVIGLFASANSDAGAALEEHKAKVQGLIGTLDQYSGAITEATQQQIAQDLAMRTMADGSTRLITAVQQLGINFTQFAQAASGNETALRTVNGQLVQMGIAALEADKGMQPAIATMERHGVSMELMTAAALGNIEAQKELVTQYGLTEGGVQNFVDLAQESLGPLAEVAMILGDQAGALMEAQDAALAAADAQADFGARLRETAGALEEHGAAMDKNAGMIDVNVAGATALAESFANLAADAAATARSIGDVAAAHGDLAAGGEAAAASMASSRAAFIEMATQAGIAAPAAERLADALGLIPEVAEIAFVTNASVAEQQVMAVVAAVLATPDLKEIRVSALTDEAIAQLDAIGIKVRELDNGEFVLDLDDSQFQAKLAAAIAQGMSLPEFLATLDIDVSKATAKMNSWREGEMRPHFLQIDAENTGVMGKLAETIGIITATVASMLLDADSGPAVGEVEATKGLADSTTGTLTLEGNPAPVLGKIASSKATADGTTGTITVDGNPAPALGKIAGAKATADGTTGTMTVTANTGPALAAARAAAAAISRMSAAITVSITRSVTERIVRSITGSGGAVIGGSGGVMRFASGGIIPGYAPGNDRIPALLSPGEAVLVPEAVRLLGARAIVGLNKLASAGRRGTLISSSGNPHYMSWGNPGIRTTGSGGGGAMVANKTYVLNVYGASNSEVNLREQFRRMEVLGV